MAVPGFSVTELLQAISIGKHIYDVFRDEYESAPAKIKELVDTSKYLADILQDIQSLLDQYGNVYPQEANFSRKLDEVDTFIEKYKALKRDYGKSVTAQSFGAKARKTWQQAWQTTQYAFEDQRARDLKAGLQLEIEKLLLFILVFALRRTVPIHRTPASSQSSSVPRAQYQIRRSAGAINAWEPLPPEAPYASQASDDSFDGLFRRLQSVRYAYDREMSLAIRHNREPNLDSGHRKLELIWHSLNVRAGLAKRNGRAPPLPRPMLLEAPSRNLNEVIVNTANSSIHTSMYPGPRPQSPSQSPRLSTTSVFSPTMSTCRSPLSEASIFSTGNDAGNGTAETTPYRPSLHSRRRPASSIDIGDPALPVWTATIKLPTPKSPRLRTYTLRDWKLETSKSGDRFVWIGETDTVTLEHYLPPNVFPRTLHSSHEDEAMHVNFYEPHSLVLKTQEGNQLNQSYNMDYIFSTPEKRKLFQEDLRGKDLVETFDFDKIWSKRTAKKYGEATIQDLKLWQDRRHPHRHSISFFANCTADRVLEFPVLSFQPPFAEFPSEKTVEIHFVRVFEGSPQVGIMSKRTSWFTRKTTASGAGLAIVSQSPPSPGTSLHSVTTFASKSDEQAPHGELLDKLKMLNIQFTSTIGFKTFTKLFKEAYREDQASILKSFPSDPVSPQCRCEDFFELDTSSPVFSELPGSHPFSELFADSPAARPSTSPSHRVSPFPMVSVTPPIICPDIPWGRSFGDFTSQ